MVAPASPFSGLPPTPRTRLIGCETERAYARSLLLDDAVPLLTLSGPGGVGKTRLALAIASYVASGFADSVIFVDLSPLADGAQVAATIAAALGVSPGPDGSLVAALQHALHARQTLLLLDNCEHVLAESADLVDALLTRCPALQVLATSRAPLNLHGEQLVVVDPLPLPSEAEPFAAVAQNAAVQLFTERARAVRPAFALTEQNAAAVAELCRQLDGLPLAIELAAARSTIFSPEAMLTQMRDRLRLLSHGMRNQPARHQTIDAAIAWSYALLDADAQALFRRLAVFVGGFNLEAAQAVGASFGSTEHDASSIVEALCQHSLVQRLDHDSDPRFTLLETIRVFALERLEELGEVDAARDAHAAYIVAMVLRDHPAFTPELHQSSWFDDYLGGANIRAALTRLTEVGDPEGAIYLAISLAGFWQGQVTPREGRTWLEWALAHTAEGATAPRGHALVSLAEMFWLQGNYDQANHFAETSYAIAGQLYDARMTSYAAHILGNIALSQHDFARAKSMLSEATLLHRLHNDRVMEAYALQVLAGAELGLGNNASALGLATDALALFREIGDDSGTASAMARLGRITRDSGKDRHASLAYREMLTLCADGRSIFSLVQAFAGLGEIASRRDQAEIAATLVGVIDAIVQNAGAERIPAAQVNFDRAVVAASVALGAERFATLRATGRTLRWQDAIVLARSVAIPRRAASEPDPHWLMPTSGNDATQDAPLGAPAAAPIDPFAGSSSPIPAAATISLTYRERDVLRLLVQRATDHEIAQQLFISRKTASNHVASILAKLGAANRREATAIAARLGLLQDGPPPQESGKS